MSPSPVAPLRPGPAVATRRGAGQEPPADRRRQPSRPGAWDPQSTTHERAGSRPDRRGGFHGIQRTGARQPDQRRTVHLPPDRGRHRGSAARVRPGRRPEPPGAFHQFANAGDEPAVVRVRVEPALRMEQLYETVAALASEGRTLRSGMPKPLDLAIFMREFEQEVRAPVAPGLVRAVMAPLAWMAMRRGLDQRYRSLPGLAARRPAPTHPGAGRVAGTRPGPARPPRSRPGTPGAAGRQRVTGRRG